MALTTTGTPAQVTDVRALIQAAAQVAVFWQLRDRDQLERQHQPGLPQRQRHPVTPA